MRLATTAFALSALAAVLFAGCSLPSSNDHTGSTSSTPATKTNGSTAPPGASAQSCETQAVDAEALRATGIACGQARQVMLGWQRDTDCDPAQGSSRSGCTIRGYRCLATVAGRGVAVSCARPGRSVAFIVRRG